MTFDFGSVFSSLLSAGMYSKNITIMMTFITQASP